MLLRVDNLSISFHSRVGTVKAVDDVSFRLEPGQTLGIVGESGSGKSVLCYSLLGLLPAPPARIENGTAIFDNMDLLKLRERELRRIRGNRIGIIFQDPMTSLNPYLRIGNQLIEPLRLHRGTARGTARETAWKQGIQALAETGLKDPGQVMNQYPHQLSGGMRQRVMIAMALINHPQILIADEPTTALDVTLQAQILELLRTLQQEKNIALIFVSHDLGVVGAIADHVLVMQQGKVVEYGPASRIFHDAHHPYTQNLIASIPAGAKTHPFDIRQRQSANVLLSVRNLRTWYPRRESLIGNSTADTIKAVDDVTFEVYRGETLGLVGESGSGKSTLGRSIMRLIGFNGGTVTLNRQDLGRLSARQLQRARPDMQMVFQDPYASLNPRLTVFDTLTEAVQVRGRLEMGALLDTVVRLVENVGLSRGSLRKYPHEFSGGQRQRIAIARAIASRPQLIIADEPVSALDVTIQAQILELLLDLVRRHRLTMIFISHDLAVVRYMADRTAVMYQGRLVELNETETVFNHPQHPYTHALLSSVPTGALAN